MNCSNLMKTKRSKTKYKVADIVRTYTVAYLQRFCSRNYIGVKKSSRKEVYVQAVAGFILENAGMIISRLMIWDLEIVRDLVNIGPGKALAVGHVCHTYAESALFLLTEYDDKKGFSWYVMPNELREAIGSKAEELLADEEYRKKSELLQFLQGLKMIFNTVYTWDARADFERCYPEYKDNNEVWRELMSSPNTLFDIEIYRRQTDMGFLRCPLDDFLYPEILDVLPSYEQQKKSHKQYSRQEILDAGRMPFPIFTCEPALRLKEHLRDDWEIDDPALLDNLMFDIWFFSQPIYDKPDKAVKLAENYETDDKELLDNLVRLINEYINATPCWALCGSSVNEAGLPGA